MIKMKKKEQIIYDKVEKNKMSEESKTNKYLFHK